MKRRLAFAFAAWLAASIVLVDGGAAGTTAGGERLRVGLVLGPGGIPDPYLNISVDGLRRAVRELGVEGRALTPGQKEGYLPSFAYLARKRYDLVLGVGFFQVEGIDAAARRFPDTTFAIVDAPWEKLPHKPRNVRGTVYKTEEAAYLAGYLAALMELRRPGKDVISSVGGFKVPTVDPFIAGYRAGAKEASPGITTLNAYARSFSDPALCRAAALNQIAKGSGVVFDVAGACGLGALEAARERRVWGVGVDADLSFLGPHILTSVLKRLDVAVYRTILALKEGRLRTGRNAVFTLRNGGVGLGRISPKVPRSLIARVERIRRLIVAGKIVVPSTLS